MKRRKKLLKAPTDALNVLKSVKFENEAEPGSTHVGIPAGVYLLTKEDAHTSEVMQSTRAEEEFITKTAKLYSTLLNQ